MARDAIEAAKAHLSDALARDGFAREAVTVSEGEGPFDTHAVVAQAEGAYPGTGVRAALVDPDGTSYGACFDHGLVAFAQARGWFVSPPSADDVVTAIDMLALDGLLQLDDDSAPSLVHEPDALVVRFTRLAFPSGAKEPLIARIPASGAFELRAEATTPEPRPTPIDAATGLVRALDSNDGMAILGALAHIPASHSDRDRAALARATMLPSEAIATGALLKLGASPASLAALRDALASHPERRDDVVQWVRDFFDEQAAQSL